MFLTDEDEERLIRDWALGCYLPKDCPNCGRYRLCECDNGKSRCEKCNWCPELNQYAPVSQ
jgi:hypothetical protein